MLDEAFSAAAVGTRPKTPCFIPMAEARPVRARSRGRWELVFPQDKGPQSPARHFIPQSAVAEPGIGLRCATCQLPGAFLQASNPILSLPMELQRAGQALAEPLCSQRPLGNVYVQLSLCPALDFPQQLPHGVIDSGTGGTASAVALPTSSRCLCRRQQLRRVPARLCIYRTNRTKLFLLQSFRNRERGLSRRCQECSAPCASELCCYPGSAVPPPALSPSPSLPGVPLKQLFPTQEGILQQAEGCWKLVALFLCLQQHTRVHGDFHQPFSFPCCCVW